MLDDGKKDFISQSGGDWTWAPTKNSRNMTCAAKSFSETDPQPGQGKACFCDDDRSTYTAPQLASITKYWEGENEKRKLAETEAAIEG